jgi:hypothetical protein
MQMPLYQPAAFRSGGSAAAPRDGLSQQGCKFPKNLACAAAVATCLATPDPVQCILGVAPDCLDCL